MHETTDRAQFLQWFPELGILFEHFNVKEMSISCTKVHGDGSIDKFRFNVQEESDVTRAQQLEDAIRNIEAVQGRYIDVGATDTEPDGVWQEYLALAYRGDSADVKDDPLTWQLFTDMDDAPEAAEALAKATREAVTLIEECPARELQDIKRVLENHIWRVCL